MKYSSQLHLDYSFYIHYSTCIDLSYYPMHTQVDILYINLPNHMTYKKDCI